jgi:NAD dependent epimerase/dehydratase family enzyme
VVGRPAVLPVPALALRLALGGFADEAVISGHRILPRVLEGTGYRFRHDTVEKALRWATGRGERGPR